MFRGDMKIAPVLLLLLFASCQRKATSALENGDFLSTEFVKRAVEKRSPLAAERGGVVQMYSVDNGKTGLSLMAIWNFHEGSEPFVIRNNGDVVIPESLEVKKIPKIHIKDRHHFYIQWPQSPMRVTGGAFEDGEFMWVGDAEAWLYRKLIVGIYTTSTGIRATFRTDGTGELPDSKRLYKVSLDHVLTPFDYIYGQGYSYGFRFDKDDLLLYDVIEDPSGAEEIARDAKWKLTLVK
jgi:hypothetical protein